MDALKIIFVSISKRTYLNGCIENRISGEITHEERECENRHCETKSFCWRKMSLCDSVVISCNH